MNARPRGLSLLELVVVVAIILLLVLLALPLLRTRLPLRLRCQSNLRELGLLLTQYAERCGGYLPDFRHSRWCGAIGAVRGGVYGWQILPDGRKVWFIDERDHALFQCPAQPAPMPNTQGIRSSYAGPSIHSHQTLSDMADPARRVLLFEFEHDPSQVLESVGTPEPKVYAYDSFEPGSGPVRIAPNHPCGGIVLFADQHLECVSGPQLDLAAWEPDYRANP
jgi:prepilin-type N-terminal cleavage/methylation domain-containing protein